MMLTQVVCRLQNEGDLVRCSRQDESQTEGLARKKT